MGGPARSVNPSRTRTPISRGQADATAPWSAVPQDALPISFHTRPSQVADLVGIVDCDRRCFGGLPSSFHRPEHPRVPQRVLVSGNGDEVDVRRLIRPPVVAAAVGEHRVEKRVRRRGWRELAADADVSVIGRDSARSPWGMIPAVVAGVGDRGQGAGGFPVEDQNPEPRMAQGSGERPGVGLRHGQPARSRPRPDEPGGDSAVQGHVGRPLRSPTDRADSGGGRPSRVAARGNPATRAELWSQRRVVALLPAAARRRRRRGFLGLPEGGVRARGPRRR